MLSLNPETDQKSREVLFTVNYVVDLINREGGIGGQTLEVIYKSGDGDWGISSKRSVELIFDYEVCAIFGSLDGQNAHLTQMAITKTEVVYLETKSSDPTLSDIQIPWFFRLIPSDKQQAETLIHSIFFKRNINNLAVIHGSSYDHRIAARTFNRISSEKYQFSIQSFEYDQLDSKLDGILNQLERTHVEGVLFFGSDQDTNHLLNFFERIHWEKPVFLPLSHVNPYLAKDRAFETRSILTENWPIPFDNTFLNLFKEEFQTLPDYNVAYSFDAIGLIIDTIKKTGDNRRKIREHLASDVKYQGVTGIIQFYENGDIQNLTKISKPYTY